MYQQVYFVEKRTGTFADVLAAYGLAAILDEILAQALGRETYRRVWIRDAGPYYAITLEQPLRAEWVENCTYFAGPAAYIITGRTEAPPPRVRARDVDETWEQFRTYQAVREKLRGASEMTNDLRRQMEDAQPPHDWSVVTLLGTREMQALKTYNQAVAQWALTRDYFTFNLQTILRMSAAPNADVEAVMNDWRRMVRVPRIKLKLSAIQLLNPHQGKGQNRPKANRLDENPPKIGEFWLLEYLKAAGLWLCAAPRVVRGDTDRKTYVLAPVNITLAAHQVVFENFSARLWNETAVKMDCIAALLYTDTLLEHSEAGQYDELDFEGYGPENVVAGFHVVQYKRLSRNAYTAINLAFLGLPAWTGEVRSRQEVLDLRKIIHEHREVIDSIDEGRSDGYNLLLHYRDFLSGQRWNDFFEFAAGYSHYAMSRMAQGQRWVPLFTTTALRRLIMATNKPLTVIVENPGFQNVAYAIRHSTVIPQGRKARGEDTLYDIRYGLGMELKRKATVRDNFVAALADFMQSYNQENSQVLENRKQQMRRDLRTTDVEAVVRLVDEYGPEVVANLLVAYGYAREPREDAETGEPTNETSTE
jgi:hypothetical protein